MDMQPASVQGFIFARLLKLYYLNIIKIMFVFLKKFKLHYTLLIEKMKGEKIVFYSGIMHHYLRVMSD